MRILIYILLLLATSCSYDSFEDAKISVDPLWTTTATVSDLSLYAGLGTVDDELVFSGNVISSDSAGNIYKKLYVKDDTGVVILNIGLFDLYERYAVGARVNISMQGAACAVVDSVLQIGYQGELDSITGDWSVETVNAPALISRHLQRGIGEVDITALPIKVGDISAGHTGYLLAVEGEFKNAETSIYSGSQTFVDSSGDQITVYTSSYASFANDSLPVGEVRICGILAYYYGKQELFLRSSDDVSAL